MDLPELPHRFYNPAALDKDVLDFIPAGQPALYHDTESYPNRHWKMTYADGAIRWSQHRHDLIQTYERTLFTNAALEAYC